jgi:malate dehydrogenase (oxaloacetate-decarboxylating)(NADP+)
VTLDVGTNNEELRKDALYLGYPRRRLKAARISVWWTSSSRRAGALSERPHPVRGFPDAERVCAAREAIGTVCFASNDDIQGTAAVSLAGVYSSTRISGVPFKDLRIMFLGAGSLATGIADLMTTAFGRGTRPRRGAAALVVRRRERLVVKSRTDLLPHNLPYAHEGKPLGFIESIDAIRPHVLIGATGAPGTFSRAVIERMSAINKRPAIFALSNPTSKAECTAEQAYAWSDGRAIFASGSPFDPVTHRGRTFRPGQGNNVYVFPGIGLGAIACRARTLPDALFLTAARTLAKLVRADDLEHGAIYPPLRDIRKISLAIAVSVATNAYKMGVARRRRPANVRRSVEALMYRP